MNRIRSHTRYLLTLLIVTFFLPLGLMASPASYLAQEDTIHVQEVLIKDTLDLEIHGPSSDVTFYMNGMVFLSNTKFHQKMIPDHVTFGVIKAYFVPLEYIALESSRPLFINDDFPYSPAGTSFTRDYRQVYFTKSVELSGRRNVEKIFEMSIDNEEGSHHNQLAFTDDPSRYLHPAISIDDSSIVFSSDRTPSAGGLDLFISRKTSSGWSTPENMGNDINSSGHEWYPYLDHQNNLYFSSSGHMGFGGYDVFVCYYNGTDWEEPQNMTDYVNSEQDDLGFSIHPNKQMAILSKVVDTESQSEVVKIKLDDNAFLVSGSGESENRDISLLLKDLIESGYTTGNFPEASHPSSAPLVTEPIDPVTVAPIAAPIILETEPKPEPRLAEPEPVIDLAPEPLVDELVTEPDPNKVVFRVQILSSNSANSNPSATIEGRKYSTFEYYYKGAYRITVGVFDTVPEASAFRTKCRNSGYSQAWVAAFRGNERETDPSVFKK